MTGFMFLLVVVIWSVILVPMWLKNHDSETEQSSVTEPDHTFIVAHFVNRPELTPRQRAFRRRRRTLMSLLTAFIASVFLSVAGSISAFWIIAPSVLLLAFVGLAANYARENSRRAPRVASSTARSTQARATHAQPAARVEASAHQTQAVSVRNERSWIPREMPEPSYVTASREPVALRNLDAQRPWTGQDMIEQAEALRATRMARLNEATERLEQARAIAMERARNAAASAERNAAVAAEIMNHQTAAIEIRRASGQ